MGLPAFSIVVATFNRPDHLESAIKSVYNQSFGDWELIIINDGSTVGEVLYSEVIDNYKHDPRILYYRKENGGAASARNFGVKKAQGKFICFLDDDDEYLSNHLSTLHDLISSHGGAKGLYRALTSLSKGKILLEQEYLSLKNLPAIERLYGNLLVTCSVALSRTIFDEYEFDEEIPISEDYDLWTRILIKHPFFEVPIVTSIYHIDLGASTHLAESLNQMKHITAFKRTFSKHETKGFISRKIRYRLLADRYLWLSKSEQKNKRIIISTLLRVRSVFYRVFAK